MPCLAPFPSCSRAVLLAALALATANAGAESTPAGLWHSIDDNSGQPRAEIRISDQGGTLAGRIERSLAPDPSREQTHCGKCSGDRKDQRIIGMEIIRGARRAAGSDWWEGGEILDPDNGKTYTLRLRVNDDGKTLLVRGYIGPFYRTQTWLRAQ